MKRNGRIKEKERRRRMNDRKVLGTANVTILMVLSGTDFRQSGQKPNASTK